MTIARITLNHASNCYLRTGGAPVEPFCSCGVQEALEEIESLTAELEAKDKEIEKVKNVLDLMLQAFDSAHPNACTQECFNSSDGHGYEIQDIAKKEAYKALK